MIRAFRVSLALALTLLAAPLAAQTWLPSPTATTIWRDYNTSGVAASGLYNPSKGDIRSWGTSVESAISQLYGASAAGQLGYQTRAALYADLAHPANTIASVWQDGTTANDGTYIKLGASGSGSWLQVSASNFGLLPPWNIGTVTMLPPGVPPAVSVSGTPSAPFLNFSLPTSQVGAIGTVTTLSAGQPAAVTMTGDLYHPLFNFSIPRGVDGSNSFAWRGAWSSSTTYAANDVVYYNGSTYIAVAGNTNVTPTAGATWNILLQGTAMSAITPGAGVPSALAQNLGTAGGIGPVVSSNAELSGLPSTYAPSVRRIWNGVSVDFSPSSSPCSILAGAGDGGSQVPTSDLKCWIGSYPDVVTATAFAGVDPTGATYSTTGIANALAASVTAGVPLYFPCGKYKLNGGAGGYVFQVYNAPIYLIGAVKGCVIFDLTDVTSGAVIFYHVLNNVKIAHSVISNLSNGSVYGTLYTGGGEFYRLQGVGTGELSGLIMKDDTFYNYPNLSASFRGSPSTLDGVLSNSTISDSVLTGVYGYYWGDQVVLERDVFYTDPVTGIESVQSSGAAGLIIDRCTFSGPSGAILLHNGIHPIISSPEVEVNNHNTTLPNNGLDSIIDISGDYGSVIAPQIINPSISLGPNGAVGAGTASTTTAIRIDYSQRAVVDGGRIGVSSSTNPHITATIHAIGYNIDSKTISYENPLATAALGNDVLLGVGSAINPSFGGGFCSNGGAVVSGAEADSFVINTGTGTCASYGSVTMPPSKFGTGWNCKAFILNSPNHVIIEGSTNPSLVELYDYNTSNALQNFPANSTVQMTCSAY